jgi:hypothetical protein
MEAGEAGTKYKWRNVYIGTNPDTGIKYFEKRKVGVIDLSQPPELPPIDGLLTKEELEAKKVAEVEKKFDEAGYPTKGSEPSSDFEPDEKPI